MNVFSVSKTPPNTQKYPLHSHNYWEIMYYLEGDGFLATEDGNIPFSQGSIIIVPPKFLHGSRAQNGFINISIGSDFDNLFMFDKIIAVSDNADFDGKQLATIIYKNQHKDDGYLSSLCSAYTHFILQNLSYDKNISRAVSEIIDAVLKRFYDTEFNITVLLKNSGYAEDYIRNEFKKQTGYTPIDFLTKIRIDHAKKIIDIYRDKLSIAEISESCGFNDAIYFSRRFKQFEGVSPKHYKTNISEVKHNESSKRK